MIKTNGKKTRQSRNARLRLRRIHCVVGKIYAFSVLVLLTIGEINLRTLLFSIDRFRKMPITMCSTLIKSFER